MKSLRPNRNRIDNLRTEVRTRKRGRIGRYFYLMLLAALGVSLFDILAGELVYLRADGMVTQDVTIVAPEFAGIVRSIDVMPGDQVVPGQTVATVRSQEMMTNIAKLAAQVAILDARLGELRIRRQKYTSLIPAARRQGKSGG